MDKEYEIKNEASYYPSIVIYLMLAFFPIIGILMIVLGVWFFFGELKSGQHSSWFVALLSISIGVFLIKLGCVFISAVFAKYTISSDGLRAKYPFTQPKLYNWEEFQEVCICYASRTTRGEPRAHKVICFVKKGEQKNGYNRWKTDNPFRHRSVIVTNYTSELYEIVKEMYPSKVVDIRDPWEIKQYEK